MTPLLPAAKVADGWMVDGLKGALGSTRRRYIAA
jgi:hypothetical protein